MIPEYDRAEQEAAEQRLECVRQQILAPTALTYERTIHCPYCGYINLASSRKICCELLRFAVASILYNQRVVDEMDAIDARREN